MRIKTEYDEDIKRYKKELAEKEALRDEYYISHLEALIPVEKYKEAFYRAVKECKNAGSKWGSEIVVTFVAKVRNERANAFTDPKIIYADDADGCEWPQVRDGRFYWNTYNSGIIEWSEEEQSYIWWRHHNKTYLNILGFIAVEPDPEWFNF